jgi:hypothetical protein
MHFERMLGRVSFRIDRHLRQLQNHLDRGGIDCDIAERRGQGACAWQREPLHRDAVDRPEQNDTRDLITHGHKPRVHRCGDRSRIDVPRVRRNDGFRHRLAASHWRGTRKQGTDVARELGRGSGIEQACDGGWANRVHRYGAGDRDF